MSTSVSELPPKLPTPQSDPYGKYEQCFNVEMMQRQVFGAFFALCEHRRRSIKITTAEIARRVGTSRSNVGKLLDGPQNWTIKTIAELSTALDVDFKFVLIDRIDPARSYDANGVSLNISTKIMHDAPQGHFEMTSSNTLFIQSRHKSGPGRAPRSRFFPQVSKISQGLTSFDIDLTAEEL